MLQSWVILLILAAYLGLLFAIAYYGDKRADQGRSIISNPLIYALSLAVYCTSWTFYGSVGRAVRSGVDFLAIYIGPTLMAILWWIVLRRIIRISKNNRITSIADFIASRYGKSALLGGLVTVVAVIGVVPYIALQLKAISSSFVTLLEYPSANAVSSDAVPFWGDEAFLVALFLAAFTILFGTRHLDATERHEGMVAAVAFESVVKLVAFLAVGVFVTFGMYNGFGDLLGRAANAPELERLFTLEAGSVSYGSWAWITGLSMLAIICLPRQFQIAVVENVDERHLKRATWLFPLYLLAMNIFVLPIAFGGLLHFPDGGVDADTFVLTLPLAEQQAALAIFVFIGGFSAATAMVIVETIALSTMVCNDLVMPALLRWRALGLNERTDLSRLLIFIRRAAIVLVLLLGYLYFRLAGEAHTLVEIGLVSFAAVAQFAPALLGGIFWKEGNRLGALVGLSAGFVVWAYTLLLPSFAYPQWLHADVLVNGPFGIVWLSPVALFGLTGFDQVSHAMFWSMLFNIGGYVIISLLTRQQPREQVQATRFVDVFAQGEQAYIGWRGRALVWDLRALLGRFLGPTRADELLTEYTRQHRIDWSPAAVADVELVQFVETQLAGAIGAASARVMVASVVKDDQIGISDVMEMLGEASQAIAYSHQLEQKSRALEAASAELRAANERLKELDRLKDDFISTVTHELRTPLTSIRAFSEILFDNPELDVAQRERFLGIIIKESERLTRLINQVLDLAKLESGNAEWHISRLDLKQVVEESLLATSQLFADKNVQLETHLPECVPVVQADQDRLIQVMLNLLSNAVKFCDPQAGHVVVTLREEPGWLRVDVCDNGPGITHENQAVIFEKFRQVGDTMTEKPQGTGLGLPISQQIITHLGGRLWVESEPGAGATFCFTLPTAPADDDPSRSVAIENRTFVEL